MAFNVELSIAVTHNFVSRVNLRDVLTFLTRHKEDAVGPTVGVASESGSGAREGPSTIAGTGRAACATRGQRGGSPRVPTRGV